MRPATPVSSGCLIGDIDSRVVGEMHLAVPQEVSKGDLRDGNSGFRG